MVASNDRKRHALTDRICLCIQGYPMAEYRVNRLTYLATRKRVTSEDKSTTCEKATLKAEVGTDTPATIQCSPISSPPILGILSSLLALFLKYSTSRIQMYAVVVSFLGLFLEFNVVEALIIRSPLAITQQLGKSLQNVSLESVAEAQYNSKGFTISPPEPVISTSGSLSAAKSSAPSLNTTLGTYIKCDGSLGFGLSPASCYGILRNPMIG